MFRDATRMVTLVAAAMKTAGFDRARLEARAGAGWTTLTELADTLVRDHGLPFKTAHAVAARLVTLAAERKDEPLARLLFEASSELAPDAHSLLGRAAAGRAEPSALRRSAPDPRRTCAVRDLRAAARSLEMLRDDELWAAAATSALADADRRLHQRAAAL